MYDYIQEEQKKKVDGIPLSRDDIIMELCGGFVTLYKGDFIHIQAMLFALCGTDSDKGLYVAAPSWFTTSQAELHMSDKITAALIIQLYDLATILLPQLERTPFGPTSLGPLWSAIRLKDMAALALVLNHLRSLSLTDPANAKSRNLYLVAEDSEYNLKGAIGLSIIQAEPVVGITQLLLDFHKEHLPIPGNEESSRWVTNSIRSRNLDALKVVAKSRHGNNWKGQADALCHVIRTNNRAYIDALLENLPINLEEGSAFTFPLFMAVRANSLGAVQAILERCPAAAKIKLPSNLKTRHPDKASRQGARHCATTCATSKEERSHLLFA